MMASTSNIYSESDLLPVSTLADMEFCERRAALHLVERIWEENVHTAQGTAQHNVVHESEGTESRGDLRIARGLMIHSFRLGLIGKADAVEFHRIHIDDEPSDVEKGLIHLPDIGGRWRVFPVEYKPGGLKQQRSFQIQLCAQAICLEEMLDCNIGSGALFYGKSRRRLDVAFDESLRSETEALARKMHELFERGVTPRAEYASKCDSCSLYDVCQPKTLCGARSSVSGYIRKSLGEQS